MTSTPASPPPGTTSQPPWLVADIGGTHARFGLVEGPELVITQAQRLRAEAYPRLIDAARAYLAGLPATFMRPVHACLAVAAPLAGDEVRFINRAWQFSRNALQRELGLERLILLNDFEALALALPRLPAEGLRRHAPGPGHAPPAAQHGTLAVVGPGTGLGVAGLIPTAEGWQAIAGEGGHVTLAACDDFEVAVLAAARRELAHVSAERLLSGVGLPLLHRSVAAVSGRSIDVAMRTEAIVQRGTEQGCDADCARTLAVFCAMLGTVAGNVALTLGARGGVYIGGGIVPRMADLFFASSFRERFEAKGRYRDYMHSIPTALIIDPQAALTGAAVALAQALEGAVQRQPSQRAHALVS